VRSLPILVAGALLVSGCHAATSAKATRESPGVPASVSAVPTAGSKSLRPIKPPRTASCGTWAESTNPTGRALIAEHGEIRDCLGLGGTWFVFELGAGGRPGGVDEFSCQRPGYAPSDVVFQASQWRCVAPPFAGGVTLLGWGRHNAMIVDNEGHELLFHPRRGSFTPEPH
jgi:hypothetical protein